MPNETLIRVSKKTAADGAIGVGPFAVGKAYAAPADALALLGSRFEAATLEKDEQAVPLNPFQAQCLEDLRAAKAAAAKAAGEAAAVNIDSSKSTPAAAGSVTGG